MPTQKEQEEIDRALVQFEELSAHLQKRPMCRLTGWVYNWEDREPYMGKPFYVPSTNRSKAGLLFLP